MYKIHAQDTINEELACQNHNDVRRMHGVNNANITN